MVMGRHPHRWISWEGVKARRYAKPVIVADSLADLHGTATLPRHLDWTGPARYDLDQLDRLVDYYRTVLIEATKPSDLHESLHRATLLRLWQTLWLPIDLQNAWQQHFPELTTPYLWDAKDSPRPPRQVVVQDRGNTRFARLR
jgi:hypothetical protein